MIHIGSGSVGSWGRLLLGSYKCSTNLISELRLEKVDHCLLAGQYRPSHVHALQYNLDKPCNEDWDSNQINDPFFP